jgi:hypothetical protein
MPLRSRASITKLSVYFDSVVTKLGNITALEYVSDKVDGASRSV